MLKYWLSFQCPSMITFRFFCSDYSFHIEVIILTITFFFFFALTVRHSLEYKKFMDIIFHTRKGQAHAAFKNLKKPSMDPQMTIPTFQIWSWGIINFFQQAVHTPLEAQVYNWNVDTTLQAPSMSSVVLINLVPNPWRELKAEIHFLYQVSFYWKASEDKANKLRRDRYNVG